MDGSFTFSRYMAQQTSTPVRLYLHTGNIINEPLTPETTDHEPNDMETLPSFSDMMGTNMVPTTDTDLSEAVRPQPSEQTIPVTLEPSTEETDSTVLTSETSQVSTVVTTHPLHVPPHSGNSSASDDYYYESADTPTVQFRLPRHNLSLKRQRQQAADMSGGHSYTTRYRYTEYQPDVVEIFDSEDEELEMALLASINSSSGNSESSLREEKDISSILKKFQQDTVNEDSTLKLLVLRSSILSTTLKGLDRKAVNFNARLYIKFSGELGEDQGGPRREFFRLVMKALQESMFFEGPDTEKIFSHSLPLLERGHYRLIGKLTALSLAQDGPGLHFLSPQLFDMMVGKETPHDEVSCLPENITTMIKLLKDADDACKEDAFLSCYADQLIDMGVPNVYQMVRRDKDSLIKIIKKHHIYYRTSGEISQFTSGMNDVNKAWDLVTSNSEVFKPIFCHKVKEITGEEMLTLFKVNYSEPGSNNRTLEDVSIFGWETFLLSIEDGAINTSFSEVLVFVTGADHIPPCGFSKLIDIDFYSCEGRLPSASTCALQLWLPRVTDPDIFQTYMLRAVKEAYGFMKV